jgi:uncharacterized protein
MKYLLLIAIVIGVLWLTRTLRKPVPPPQPNGSPSSASAPAAEALPPEDIVACAQCGIHLPRSEALPGRGGLFCGEAHRAVFEKTHPVA